MKFHRAIRLSVTLCSIMVLTSLVSMTSLAQEPANTPLATIAIEWQVVYWELLVENGGSTLTVAGPGDSYFRLDFPAGEHPWFSSQDPEGVALPDGIYSYELVLLPVDALAPDEVDQEQRGIAPADGSAERRVYSGDLAIVGGGFVTPGAEEEEEPAEPSGPIGEVPTPQDQVILDDLIVDGSICVGFDCVNGESFGFDTLRLKENNLRIKFQDTSTAANFPTNDWQLTANDSANGGKNKFSIDDIDGGRTPFTVEAGAPSHSLYVRYTGRIGLGTNLPVVQLHTVDGNTPTLRLQQDGSSGWTRKHGTWPPMRPTSSYGTRPTAPSCLLGFRHRHPATA